MRVDALTPVLEVVPGEPVIGRVRVVNDTNRDTSYRIRVVGIDSPTDWRPIAGGAVPAGTEVHVEVPIQVPDLLGLGHHPIGVEIVSDQASERPGLASMTVAVESVINVLMRAEPSIVRGTTSGKFRLELENREPDTVDIRLVGGGNDVTATFKPDRIRLQPGERAVSKGKLKGRRRWSGDPEQRFVTLTARGRASVQSITTRFVQRSMFPWRFRTLVAALIVLALWILGAVAYVWYQREQDRDAERERERSAQLADADRDGDRSGVAGSGDGGDGTGGADGSGPDGTDGADAAARLPSTTTFTGAVAMSDGSDPAGVRVSIDEIPLGQAAQGATPSAFSGDLRTSKIWSVGHGRTDPVGISTFRMTETVRSRDTDENGTWKIEPVALRRSHEVSYFKEGYNTQSIVVTPPEDGSTVELEVEMQPADGVISGVVRDTAGAALGGVTLVATNGELTFSTTSSTAAPVGAFSFNGLSTPAVYSVTATRVGFGTEVVQFELVAGEPREGQTIRMKEGVGSISGQIRARQSDSLTEEGFGGVTITVTNGDYTRQVTSLTQQGLEGTFSVPRLPIPGVYTVTASFEGYSDATLTVDLDGNRSGLSVRMTSQLGVLRGRVVDSDGDPVTEAGITLSRDMLSFSSNTFSDDDGGSVATLGEFIVTDGTAWLRELTTADAPGEFRISDLPPGEYLMRVVHGQHAPYSRTITVTAGQFEPIPDIVLEDRAEVVGRSGGLLVQAYDTNDQSDPVTGLVEGVRFHMRVPGTVPPTEGTLGDRPCGADEWVNCWLSPSVGDSIVEFEILDVGSYVLRASAEDFRTKDVLVAVSEAVDGETPPLKQVALRPFGAVVVRVTDSVTGDEVGGYRLVLRKEREGLSDKEIEPDDPFGDSELDGIAWSTGVIEDLDDGLWQIVVTEHPPGYRITDQDIIFQPPVIDTVTDSLAFVVSPDSRPTIRIDLVARAFPELTVRTYAPVRSDALPRPAVEVLGVDGLTVKLECGLEQPTNPTFSFEASGAGLPNGTYRIARSSFTDVEVLDADDCRIAVRGQDYDDAIAALDGPLRLATDPSGATQTSVTFDRQISVVMLPEPVTVTGRVFWFDGERNVYLPDTLIASTGEVTVAYPPTQTTGNIGGAPPQPPVPDSDVVVAVWADDPDNPDPPGTPAADSTRFFTLDRQVFDAGSYSITYPSQPPPTISPGQFDVTISFDGDPPLGVAPDSETTAISSPTIDGTTYGYEVELLDPDDGVLRGCLTVRTTRTEANFDEILDEAVAESRGTQGTLVKAPPEVTDPACQDQGFSQRQIVQLYHDDVDDPGTDDGSGLVAAGVWTVDYPLPTGVAPSDQWYQPDPNNGPSGAVSQRVEPATTVSGFDRTVIENATINLTLNPGDPDPTSPGPSPTLDTTYTLTTFEGDEWTPVGIGDAQAVEIRGVPVDDEQPFGDPFALPPTDGTVEHVLRLAVPDFDVAGATVTVDGVGPVPYGTGIAVGTRPGDEIDVTVDIDPAGSISGSVVGYPWVLDDPLTLAEFGDPSQLEVYARPVDFTTSTDEIGATVYTRTPPLPIPSEFDPTDTGWIRVDRSDAVDLGFQFSGAPGYYEFGFVHPDYRRFQLLDGIGAPGGDVSLSDGGQLFEMENKKNNAIAGSFGLQLLPATLDLNLWSAFDPADSGVNVGIDGLAQMNVTLLNGSPNGVPIGSGNVYDVAQPWDVSASNPTLQLQPGNYRLEMFKKLNGEDQVYPLTIEITLTRDGLRVDATLPSLKYEIWVTVTVVNSAWTASEDESSENRLPVPDGISLTRSWEAPDALLTGGGTTTLVPNSSPPLPGTSGRYLTETIVTGVEHDDPDVYRRVVKFTGIPSGEHDIRVELPDALVGYVPSVGSWLNVPVPEVDTDPVTRLELILEVQDVSVDVTITDADDHDFPRATAVLSYGLLDVSDIAVVRSAQDPQRITLRDVPPRRGDYSLRINDDLHTSKSVPFSVAVDATRPPGQPDSSPQIVATEVTADRGRLEMLLRLEQTNGGCPDPLGPATATCLALPDGGPNQGGGVVEIDGAEVAHAGGSLTVDFTPAEPSTTHTLAVSNGVAYEEYAGSVIVPLGRIVNPEPAVKLRKLALVNLDVTGADVADITVLAVVTPATAPVDRFDPPNDSKANRWKFYFDPSATSVVFTVSSGDLFPVEREVTSLPTGYVETIDIELGLRTVTVTATPVAGGPDFVPTIELDVAGPPAYNESVTAAAATTSFERTFPIDNGPIPNDGQAQVTVTADGYRTRQVDGSATPVGSEQIPVMVYPKVTVSGQLTLPQGSQFPLVLTATGADPDTFVKATSGNTTYYATIDASDGSYEFDDKFDEGTWTVSASVLGWGGGTTTPQIAITDVSPVTESVPSIALSARQIGATISVVRPGGTAVPTASWEALDADAQGITLPTTPIANTSSAVVTITESGTASPQFVLRENTSMRTLVTLDLATASLNTVTDPDTVTLSRSVTLYQAPELEGLVLNAADGTPELNRIYLIATCSSPLSGAPQDRGSGGGLFGFGGEVFDNANLLFDPASTNDYCLFARGDSVSGTRRTGQLVFTIAIVSNAIDVQAGTASGELLIQLGSPAVTLSKPAPSNADEDGSGDVSAGDTLTYTITATNTGGVSLTGVDVRDDTITPDRKQCSLVATNATCVLTGTYVVETGDLGGSFVNNARVDSGQTDRVNTSHSLTIPSPSLSVDKPAPSNADEDGSGDVSVGDTLTFTVTATNDGTATLTNVVVTDPLTSPVSTRTCATLAPAGTCVLSVAYVVVSGDLGGTINSTATADSAQTGADTDDQSVSVPSPSLSVSKPAPSNADEDGSGDVTLDDTLTYTITVTNDGGARLTNVVISDSLITTTGGSTPCALVLPGATCTLIGTYVVTAADVTAGQIDNTATANSDQTAADTANRSTNVN